jgi:hypothetical protein
MVKVYLKLRACLVNKIRGSSIIELYLLICRISMQNDDEDIDTPGRHTARNIKSKVVSINKRD